MIKIMPHLSSLERGRAIGQLQTGVRQDVVAATFGVSQATISKLQRRYQDTTMCATGQHLADLV